MLQSAVRPLLTGEVEDWRSEFAYSAGLQAFIYGFPYIYNAQVRHKWVTEPRNPKFVPYAAVNEFWHASQLMDATYRDGGCPNNDTLYSIAWLDLGPEPIILSHPDMGERYFTFELMGVSSDNIDYIGQRTTGSEGGQLRDRRARAGTGDLPEDVDQSRAHSPSRTVLVMGRTLVDNDPDDVAEVKKLQEQYLLTPLSEWGKQNPNRSGHRDVLEPIEPEDDPIGPFKTLNAMLAENPPPPHHEVLMEQFAHVGIGPGLDLDEQPEAVKQGLRPCRADRDGAAQAAVPQRRLGDTSCTAGAIRRPRSVATATTSCSVRPISPWPGSCATTPTRASISSTSTTPTMRRYKAEHRYRIHFDADNMPPVDSFWSLGMYGTDLNLVANPIDRYSIGDRTAGLKKDSDGGLTIHLQAETPEGDEAANWLPSPSEGEWFAILRLYRPRPEVIDATWECPPIERVVS